MRARIMIAAIIIFLFIPMSIPIHAEVKTSVDQLDKLSDEALQMVKLQRYGDAKKLLDYFSRQFTSVSKHERSLSEDELRIVTVSFNEAVEATANLTMNHDERINRVTKFRLVVDTITSKYEPLWTEMESPIMSILSEMKAAAYNGDKEHFHSKLNAFLSLYDMIYPSLKLSVEVGRIQQLDTRINYIDRFRPEILSESASLQELEALEADLQRIFADLEEDEADPSLWWVIISTGSIIVATLTYAGWRKYQGEKEKEKDRSRRH
ncbi:sporulation protein YpjB [Bacillus sp. Bva_UNVM-123]|uniref:sporulation protein YpjB n=1 Tax=Bacillus sp. Bva_UNVM-123 TaxID=2829798 RepID=UPI00391F0FF5